MTKGGGEGDVRGGRGCERIGGEMRGREERGEEDRKGEGNPSSFQGKGSLQSVFK